VARRARASGWHRTWTFGAALIVALSGCASRKTSAPPLSSRDVLETLEAERQAAIAGPREGAARYAALRLRFPDDEFLRAREAELWLEAGETPRAKSLLTTPEASESADALLVLGRIALAEADVEDALRCFEAARQARPQDDRALERIVAIHLERGDSDAVATVIDTALSERELIPLPLLELRLRMALDEPDAATITRVAERILATHPARSHALRALARERLETAPELALALLAAMPHTLEVTGMTLAARDALRNRRRSR
jgi:tetratricopeptide (TPR) repeat protein